MFKIYDKLKSKSKCEVRHYKKFLNEIKEPKNQEYPINIQRDIPKFEKLNDMKINVFALNGKLELIPIYSNRVIIKPNDEIVNLLSISNETNNHLCLIRNISALTNYQDTKEHKRYIC